ncbi:nucleotide exchange factor GrpE [Streptomyces monashensis]|uniref:Protein GrpE n=1 Tax=Streptomyces monashensis TaxID=1678012 RepID=A0A1S2QDD4_9ACTN|nr:nucleotide exchange factor GrpE [Streptomyces monashensis]OIK03713.1 nucleotide exchange factor GrpE [Streptomyces monashensis]
MERGRLPDPDPARLHGLLEERTADLQRVKAEYDNYRKRVHRDRLAMGEAAVANVLRTLLPVLDAVDRACAHETMTPGLREIADTLRTQLGSLGVEAFGEEGDPFDPACHDALTHHVRADTDRPICTKILRAGYRHGTRLLRPATVEVTGPRPPTGNPLGPDRGELRSGTTADGDRPSLTCAGRDHRHR